MKLSISKNIAVRIFLTFLAFLANLTSVTAQANPEQKQVLIARFEITKGADDLPNFRRPRNVLTVYSNYQGIKVVQITGKNQKVSELGTFSSIQLVRRLEKLKLPKIDYQKYFADLNKRPAKQGKGYWLACDGQEVEVEMRIKGTTVKFKMWNPDTFFYNHADDKIANSVNQAIEAVIITLGKRAVYF